MQLENFFLFNDRHRGMRMDIDGMSYEVCLNLESPPTLTVLLADFLELLPLLLPHFSRQHLLFAMFCFFRR